MQSGSASSRSQLVPQTLTGTHGRTQGGHSQHSLVPPRPSCQHHWPGSSSLPSLLVVRGQSSSAVAGQRKIAAEGLSSAKQTASLPTGLSAQASSASCLRCTACSEGKATERTRASARVCPCRGITRATLPAVLRAFSRKQLLDIAIRLWSPVSSAERVEVRQDATSRMASSERFAISNSLHTPRAPR